MASKVIAVIGARLGSSRLPGKQLLPLAGKPLIARLVDRLRTVEEIDDIIVATSAAKQNLPLCDWAEEYGVSCFAWNGNEDDLVGRVDAVVREYDATTFVYVCGDCPMVEPATIRNLINASRYGANDGIAVLKPADNGCGFIHEGFDVFNRNFWDNMTAVAHEPFEREHVGAVYHHLQKVHPSERILVDEADIFAQCQHRLSVDTPSDYEFMSRVYADWYAENAADTLVDLMWLINRLLKEPDLAAINANVRQKKVHDVPYKVAILCEVGSGIGLGHLTRACVAATALKNELSADVSILIRAEPIEFKDLEFVKHKWVSNFDDIQDVADIVIVDLKEIDQSTQNILTNIAAETLVVGVDINSNDANLFDLVWMPSVHVPKKLIQATGNRLRYGLPCYLLREPHGTNAEGDKNFQNSVIVLTGGADPVGLSQSLPQQLVETVTSAVDITWIRGPYAKEPLVDTEQKQLSVLQSPENLHSLIASYGYALCVYGVTFYECLRAGVPTVVFDPIGAATSEEWQLLREMYPDFVASDAADAISKLNQIIQNGHSSLVEGVADQLAQGPSDFAATVKAFYIQKQELQHATA